MGGERATLIVSNSAFNCFVGAAIASQMDGPVHLLQADGGNTNRFLVETLAKSATFPFSGVTFFDRNLVGKSNLQKGRMIRRNLRETRQLFQDLKPKRVYVGNDALPTTQLAIQLARQIEAETIYYDEGTNAYCLFPERSYSLPWRILFSVVFGNWWKSISVNGTYEGPTKRLRFFPEVLPTDPLNEPMSQRPFHHERFVATIQDAVGELVDANLSEPSQRIALVLLSHSEAIDAPDTYLETIRKLAARLIDGGYRVLVKGHPRERPANLSAIERLGCETIEPRMPAEMLLVSSGWKPEVLIGDLSTALFFARWHCPGIRVFSTSLMTKVGDESGSTLCRQLGVRLVDSINEIE